MGSSCYPFFYAQKMPRDKRTFLIEVAFVDTSSINPEILLYSAIVERAFRDLGILDKSVINAKARRQAIRWLDHKEVNALISYANCIELIPLGKGTRARIKSAVELAKNTKVVPKPKTKLLKK